jgi:hypothetical protein
LVFPPIPVEGMTAEEGMARYKAMYAESIADPDAFWGRK